jgi:hypothetical protein
VEPGVLDLEDDDLLMVASVAFVPVPVSWKSGNKLEDDGDVQRMEIGERARRRKGQEKAQGKGDFFF